MDTADTNKVFPPGQPLYRSQKVWHQIGKLLAVGHLTQEVCVMASVDNLLNLYLPQDRAIQMMNIVCIADEAPASAIHISTKDFGSHQVARKQTPQACGRRSWAVIDTGGSLGAVNHSNLYNFFEATKQTAWNMAAY